MRISSGFRFLTCLAGAGLALSACGAPSGEAGNSESEDSLAVVASTDVYGSIARQIGGDRVRVSSIISGPTQDPHSYEATVRDKLAVSEADVVVLNGGGYDGFMEKLTDSVEMPADRVISAVDVSGLNHEAGEDAHGGEEPQQEEDHHDHGTVNEHVWYDLHSMTLLVAEIARVLGEADPGGAVEFDRNAENVTSSLNALEEDLVALAQKTDGASIAVTEPVPLYLLEDAGFENLTPADYTEALEEGTDVSIVAMRNMEQLVSEKDISFLAYNQQTESQQTEAVRDVAEKAGVPVVNFTETLPEDQEYVEWMEQNVEAVTHAVGK
ncbi:metal ABC transporter solute-binding protein, Zn/Mn family [Arthrobacter roseus]|uniref:metal ABC transporter solute-binding protein, Zn/Mn family n=1 Tax=Arthrobacter roseus TaxID=136274 RepID=UPI001963A93F|nr:zinc ABC transporter substrate-binding protein [Arthrobacter roseus]MBM7849046.1 zinc/manganese transport system substrate-binding protein [Arthrobacter roseus]